MLPLRALLRTRSSPSSAAAGAGFVRSIYVGMVRRRALPGCSLMVCPYSLALAPELFRNAHATTDRA
jgi:hypothetical protein